MTILSMGAGTPWQARIAYAAALLFTLTSASTNALYGFRKGTDLPTSLIWFTVSIAASIVFALSVPALLSSLSTRKWAQALLVCIGFATCGTYSIVAALGSASGGRDDAAAVERTLNSSRSRAQSAYDKATSELQNLKPARPLAELEALTSVKAPCRIIVSNGLRQTVCAHPPKLLAELGIARRRAELEGKIETANKELGAPATRQANSDTAALAGYLDALGWQIEPETLNKLLALLAVLVIELGGGASLAVGMALSDSSSLRGRTVMAGDGAVTVGSLPAARPVTPCHQPPPSALPPKPEIAALAGGSLVAGTLPSRSAGGARERLLGMLEDGQGVMRGCQEEIGRAIGVSRVRARQLLDDLAAAGFVRVRTSRTGTVVLLAASAKQRSASMSARGCALPQYRFNR